MHDDLGGSQTGILALRFARGEAAPSRPGIPHDNRRPTGGSSQERG